MRLQVPTGTEGSEDDDEQVVMEPDGDDNALFADDVELGGDESVRQLTLQAGSLWVTWLVVIQLTVSCAGQTEC